ncbi:MAG: deoxyribodipyrimidine photo-lyase [Ferruginibacter sp.]
METTVNIFWFRRDLRLDDNAGLYHALKHGKPVIPIFIFDEFILNKLENKADRRVEFIHLAILSLQQQLEKLGSCIEVFYGSATEVFTQLISRYSITTVFTNQDYEPYAIERDAIVKAILKEKNITFQTFKDQVIFDQDDVTKDNGEPYTVFTAYSRKWKAALKPFHFKPYPTKKYFKSFYQQTPGNIPTLKEIGFKATGKAFPSPKPDSDVIIHYGQQRNFPGMNGTSRLGLHLRFGTISIRQLAAKAQMLSETYLNELIWRDFYHMILWHFQYVGKGKSFKPAYDNIEWRRDAGEFEKWCQGKTGYPIVDAGMRELNETGFMHNRVRMIVASFLCKHLLLDWRLGEAYFAEKLLDFDFAANNGGWQWASGSGCDAAPYFRIFNPYLQTKKFDPELIYIKKWVPEFQEFSYPRPIVDHEFARKRCLEVYSRALKKIDN